eukprot:TRINITY_DN19562_c0_g1_i1.p1 TRINITY_DN19562_c0_g1~~TRINITY_DN19562_c0_g1_i1.p1  ORF type:complete len:340 (-),score=31.43 TRINITY_DN19562_c0_g1_i1:376-1395(-)
MSEEAGVPVFNTGSVKDNSEFRCHVENCTKTLTDSKKYYKRHRVCEEHLKMNQLLVDGELQRFCQQCGKFHPIDKFDNDKRSCREKLKIHKQRRDDKISQKKTNSGSGESGGCINTAEPKGTGVKRGPVVMDSFEKEGTKKLQTDAITSALLRAVSSPTLLFEQSRTLQSSPYDASLSCLASSGQSLPLSHSSLFQSQISKAMLDWKIPSTHVQFLNQQQQQQQQPQSNLFGSSVLQGITGRSLINKQSQQQAETVGRQFETGNDENIESSIQQKEDVNGEKECIQEFELPQECFFNPRDLDNDDLLDLSKIEINEQVQLYQSFQNKPYYMYILDETDF